MVIHGKYVNWFNEELDHFYGHNNNGYVHGIYLFDCAEDTDFPYYVEWFKDEQKAREALINI
jgi:hypothetical protein